MGEARDPPSDRSPCPHLTVSIGVAAVKPSVGSSSNELIGSADDALYQAKETGRNRVIAS